MTTDGMVQTARAIGGAEIGRCLVRIHHDRFTETDAPTEPLRDRLLAKGIAYEDSVIAHLVAIIDDAVDLRSVSIDQRTSRTLASMDARTSLIIGGRLESTDGQRVGMPDLLVRLDDGYAPVEIKHHKVIGSSGRPAAIAALATLAAFGEDEVPYRSFRRRNLLQVAHYRALLDDLGYASARPIGGVIGADEPAACLWLDLSAGERPIIDEYQTYLVDADAAIEHGLSHPDAPLHSPWAHTECKRCDWAPLCTAELVAIDDPTLLRGIGRTERIDLAANGITTAQGVAALPLETEIVEPAVVMQARARAAGALLRRAPNGDGMVLPSAATEVDFDIETINGRIYLAGMYITEGNESHFTYLADWTGSEEGERDLVASLFKRFANWPSDAVMFHWTDYEVRTLSAAGDRYGLSVDGYETVEEWFADHAVDLCAWSRSNLVSPEGHGLKVIAPLCGFVWRDDDPGGLQSEIWFEGLQEGDQEMQPRILEYNEDDVRAQAAVRSFVRSNDSGAGPGSSLPSVHDWHTMGSTA